MPNLQSPHRSREATNATAGHNVLANLRSGEQTRKGPLPRPKALPSAQVCGRWSGFVKRSNVSPRFERDNCARGRRGPFPVESAVRPEVVVVEHEAVNVGLSRFPILQPSGASCPGPLRVPCRRSLRLFIDDGSDALRDDVFDAVDGECDAYTFLVGSEAVGLDQPGRVLGAFPGQGEGR